MVSGIGTSEVSKEGNMQFHDGLQTVGIEEKTLKEQVIPTFSGTLSFLLFPAPLSSPHTTELQVFMKLPFYRHSHLGQVELEQFETMH